MIEWVSSLHRLSQHMGLCIHLRESDSCNPNTLLKQARRPGLLRPRARRNFSKVSNDARVHTSFRRDTLFSSVFLCKLNIFFAGGR